MEEGVTSQRTQVTARSSKRQENKFSFRAPRRNPRCWHLDFKVQKNQLGISGVYSKENNFGSCSAIQFVVIYHGSNRKLIHPLYLELPSPVDSPLPSLFSSSSLVLNFSVDYWFVPTFPSTCSPSFVGQQGAVVGFITDEFIGSVPWVDHRSFWGTPVQEMQFGFGWVTSTPRISIFSSVIGDKLSMCTSQSGGETQEKWWQWKLFATYKMLRKCELLSPSSILFEKRRIFQLNLFFTQHVCGASDRH